MRTYRYDRLMQWSECDAGGIIFFPNYARWMVDGLNQMFLSLGIDPNAILDAETRGGLPDVVSQSSVGDGLMCRAVDQRGFAGIEQAPSEQEARH